MFLHWLCRCAVCGGSLTQCTFPVCALCFSSLRQAPKLCTTCGGPSCDPDGKECRFPWRSQGIIHSYSGRYLMLGHGFEVLKSWKKNSGPVFDRRILTPLPSLLQTWIAFEPHAIVPLPQNYERAWKMRGSRALKIAEWVAEQIQTPVLAGLEIKNKRRNPRQAELKITDRLMSRIEFQISAMNPKKIQRVILVDDFMTTGKTIRQAALALKNWGVQEIHSFCLGIRPPYA